ncbi:MSC_0622 family F1-like ATPase gamma subunit [Mycoplasma feriruminatoris]|uniref:ATP synthase gamma chain n=1 Tax=Mycoplasma feriruminatoris TaxID=1179777 RepID=A0A654IAP5_9MOLU|nr:hypothetical protein [Mycoplasma feriruminatoris]WFQ94235.1 hypothetical protein MFERI15220_00303 [Mycoplasma feriruminatoris]VZK65163.1 hypothetical protein MF5292_00328 [Mycoplasma feriruminatoris]VZR75308.1 hypothetical protein MF5294_00328 [Mycoplasma feriruminatoris]VZR97453.1 hypothetical protein MF5293_00327 [Mycoplasma feriruminatoris]
MDLKKVENKLESLVKIENKVRNDKNILLIDIIKQNSLLNFYVNNALTSQEMILLLKQHYNIKTSLITLENKSFSFINKLNNFLFQKRDLWIYVTEEQEFATDSYSRYEQHILKTAKLKQADFISIGSRASKFCKENKLNLIYEIDSENRDLEVCWKLTQIIKFLFSEQNYASLHCVINSNKNKQGSFTILPLSKFDLDSLVETKQEINLPDIKNIKIYPSIDQYLLTQIDNFLITSINSLLVESSFYKAKNQLIKTNKTINEVEEEIKKIKKKIIRIKREKEIEEIVLLTSNNKKFLLKGGVN